MLAPERVPVVAVVVSREVAVAVAVAGWLHPAAVEQAKE